MSVNVWESPNTWASGANISVIESTSGIVLSTVNPEVSIGSQISIVESLSNILLASSDPTIQLSGSITITESTINIDVRSLNPRIGEEVIISAEFVGALKNSEFNGRLKRFSTQVGS